MAAKNSRNSKPTAYCCAMNCRLTAGPICGTLPNHPRQATGGNPPNNRPTKDPRQSKGGTNLQPTPANPRQSKHGKPKRAGSQSITKRTPTQDSPRVEAQIFLQKAKSKPATWGAVSNQLAQVDWRHAPCWQARKPSNVGACNIAPGRQAKCTPTSPSLKRHALCAIYLTTYSKPMARGPARPANRHCTPVVAQATASFTLIFSRDGKSI